MLGKLLPTKSLACMIFLQSYLKLVLGVPSKVLDTIYTS